MRKNKDVQGRLDATVGEAASFLRCSTKTVFRRIKTGQIPAFRYTYFGPLLIPWTKLRTYRKKAMKGKDPQ
jgi:hypothetical protein